MPLYDYVCTACGTRVEVIHGVNEAGPTVCTACGGAMRKALSPPAIVFKGSGWAKKDARAKTTGSSSAADKSEAPKADVPKSDSAKPAASETSSAD
jgi:putative FmdB family regulatory protein